MIGIQFTFTNKDGQVAKINDHVTDPLRFIALQSYPQMDVDIKASSLNLQGQHGSWDFFSYYGSRIATFSGVIVGTSEADVDTIKTNLEKVLRIPVQSSEAKQGDVTITWTDPNGKDWQFDARLPRPINYSRSMKQNFRLDFSFTLRSPNPFIVSQTLTTTNGTKGYSTFGLKAPVSMPLDWNETVVNKLTVTNNGIAAAQTVVQLNGHSLGAITNPVIENLTTGKKMTVNTILADENSYIVIDSQNGTIVDQDGVDLTGLVTNDSEFVLIQPNGNELLYTSDEVPEVVLYYPTATFSVKHRDTNV